ncbi:MAG: GNAT family N-acetyltransferase [Limnochordia bacterium]|jgi:GNAT superfamily N-acetyltransferase|nr:GNAT family N-acetyltransferase [Limnochordia bacterium]
MQLTCCHGSDKEYQRRLNHLLKGIFFDFQFWYDLDLWDDNYESYSITEGDEIVSNICVYKTRVLFKGEPHLALSLGAVATREDCRGKGLSRRLMEHIISKYDGTPMYLSANDEVLGFYPKFGFRRVYEKQPVSNCAVDNRVQAVRLSYNDPKIQQYVFNRAQFSGELDCLNTASINMFHIHLGYLKDSLFEIPELNTLVVAQQQGTTLHLIGIFPLKPILFTDLLPRLPFCSVEKVQFGFMPYWSDLEYVMEEQEMDPLFIRGLTCDLGDFKFPKLSTT